MNNLKRTAFVLILFAASFSASSIAVLEGPMNQAAPFTVRLNAADDPRNQ